MSTNSDIYDRIIAAWPHLEALVNRARTGDLAARNTVATNVLLGIARDPLTIKDIWQIAQWQSTAYGR